MVTTVNYQQIIDDALSVFHNGFACSESVIYSLRKNFGWDELSDDAIAMSTGFPWGLGGVGCLCGAVAGGAMCLGYVFGRRTPGDPCAARCQQLTCEYAQKVLQEVGSTCCGKLTAEFADRNSPERKAKCSKVVACCAKTASEIIVRECGLQAK